MEMLAVPIVHLENSIGIGYEHRPAENCYW